MCRASKKAVQVHPKIRLVLRRMSPVCDLGWDGVRQGSGRRWCRACHRRRPSPSSCRRRGRTAGATASGPTRSSSSPGTRWCPCGGRPRCTGRSPRPGSGSLTRWWGGRRTMTGKQPHPAACRCSVSLPPPLLRPGRRQDHSELHVGQHPGQVRTLVSREIDDGVPGGGAVRRTLRTAAGASGPPGEDPASTGLSRYRSLRGCLHPGSEPVHAPGERHRARGHAHCTAAGQPARPSG